MRLCAGPCPGRRASKMRRVSAFWPGEKAATVLLLFVSDTHSGRIVIRPACGLLPKTMTTVQATLDGKRDGVLEEDLMIIGQISPIWT